MTLPKKIAAQAKDVIGQLIARHETVATAESCTGGLIAGALTSVSGSSAAVYGGFITYANDAKTRMIGVPEALIAEHGAVSEAVARAMADGARKTSGTDWAVAVTGVAGPTGGTSEKPVGLVHFGLAGPDGTTHHRELFPDTGRDGIRQSTVLLALELLKARLDKSSPSH